MTSTSCLEMRLLVQADIDGELSVGDAGRVGAHLEECPACSELQARLISLTGQLRRELPRHQAPESLKEAVRARLALVAPTAVPLRQARSASRVRPSGRSFAAGFAVAACLAAFAFLTPTSDNLPATVVAAHIRALQPGHLIDIESTDQHTVKPWFDGRLPFAPPVKDLAQAGYPLAGGRLDYLPGRTVATLVYRHGPHVINLFAWPRTEAGTRGSGSREGYNFERWEQDGMWLWAVSDLDPRELADFVREWQAR